jgi:hypothetical protein
MYTIVPTAVEVSKSKQDSKTNSLLVTCFPFAAGYRPKLRETDDHRLDQRQKGIDKGKNTAAYHNYIKMMPKYAFLALHSCLTGHHSWTLSNIYATSWDIILLRYFSIVLVDLRSCCDQVLMYDTNKSCTGR